MGLEIAGEVIALGAEVHGFGLGDRVMGIVGGGGYAELSRIDHRMAMRIPEGLNYARGPRAPCPHSTRRIRPHPRRCKWSWNSRHPAGSRHRHKIYAAADASKLPALRDLGADVPAFRYIRYNWGSLKRQFKSNPHLFRDHFAVLQIVSDCRIVVRHALPRVTKPELNQIVWDMILSQKTHCGICGRHGFQRFRPLFLGRSNPTCVGLDASGGSRCWCPRAAFHSERRAKSLTYVSR
jgi:hypothetical protein